MPRLSGHDISVELPQGWDGYLFRRVPQGVERAFPVMHFGNFALPQQRGDFGGGAVEKMGPTNLFVALVEYEPESAGKPLFSKEGLGLPLTAGHFNPYGLQRVIRGQAGHQRFFNISGRAFCLYVVIGSIRNAKRLAKMATTTLESLEIKPRLPLTQSAGGPVSESALPLGTSPKSREVMR